MDRCCRSLICFLGVQYLTHSLQCYCPSPCPCLRTPTMGSSTWSSPRRRSLSRTSATTTITRTSSFCSRPPSRRISRKVNATEGGGAEGGGKAPAATMTVAASAESYVTNYSDLRAVVGPPVSAKSIGFCRRPGLGQVGTSHQVPCQSQPFPYRLAGQGFDPLRYHNYTGIVLSECL